MCLSATHDGFKNFFLHKKNRQTLTNSQTVTATLGWHQLIHGQDFVMNWSRSSHLPGFYRKKVSRPFCRFPSDSGRGIFTPTNQNACYMFWLSNKPIRWVGGIFDLEFSDLRGILSVFSGKSTHRPIIHVPPCAVTSQNNLIGRHFFHTLDGGSNAYSPHNTEPIQGAIMCNPSSYWSRMWWKPTACSRCFRGNNRWRQAQVPGTNHSRGQPVGRVLIGRELQRNRQNLPGGVRSLPPQVRFFLEAWVPGTNQTRGPM